MIKMRVASLASMMHIKIPVTFYLVNTIRYQVCASTLYTMATTLHDFLYNHACNNLRKINLFLNCNTTTAEIANASGTNKGNSGMVVVPIM